MKRIAAIFALLLLVAIAAVAQDANEPDSDNGFLLNLLQNKLSAPGRQIRLSGVSGALSSQARIARITISDDKGPWLQVDNAQLDWSRLALLRGRVDINRLSADRIAWLRKAEMPPPQRGLPQVEAQPFSLPELPVSIQVRELAVGTVSFAPEIFGQAAEFNVTGNVSLAGGALDSALNVKRLDGPGGGLTLKAAFSNKTRQLDVDLALQEPQGGVVATLLKIEGAPPIDLKVQGSGPLDNVDVNFSLDAGPDRIAQGTVALRARDDGLGFDVDFGGGLSPLVPQQFRDFFAGQSTVKVTGVKKSAGGLRIDQMTLAGAVLHLDGGLETGNDGFLRSLALTGSLGDPAGPAVLLPVPGGRTSLHSAELYVDFGGGSRWSGFVALDRLQAADIEMEDVTLRLGGLAQNLEDAEQAQRHDQRGGARHRRLGPRPRGRPRSRQPDRPLCGRGAASGRPGHAAAVPAQRQRAFDLHRRATAEARFHRPKCRACRRSRGLLRARQPPARGRGRLARQWQRDAAQRRLRPHLRGWRR